MTNKILISACLTGQPVRYDGRSNDNTVAAFHHQLQQWQDTGRLIPVCPEMLGGLPTPRPAAEINADRVITRSGADVTAAFHYGAQQALAVAQQHNVIAALLAAKSPSCGSDEIYNGEFNSILIPGAGITTRLLRANNIACFGPKNFHQLVDYMQQHEPI